MVLEIDVNPESVKKLEKFIGTGKYKELAVSTQSFSRKLNEERKMRIPYVDGQTGVAQKHYNNSRISRERMPGVKPGQVYSYPQKRWHKQRYQYLQYFMLPKHMRFDPADRATVPQEHPALVSEDSNSNLSQEKWGDYYMNEDDYAMQEPGSEPESDSDFEYEGGKNKRGKGKKPIGRTRGTPKVPSSSRSRRQEEEKTPSSEREHSQTLVM